jgi:hypothetical protein
MTDGVIIDSQYEANLPLAHPIRPETRSPPSIRIICITASRLLLLRANDPKDFGFDVVECSTTSNRYRSYEFDFARRYSTFRPTHRTASHLSGATILMYPPRFSLAHCCAVIRRRFSESRNAETLQLNDSIRLIASFYSNLNRRPTILKTPPSGLQPFKAR